MFIEEYVIYFIIEKRVLCRDVYATVVNITIYTNWNTKIK
jgi:hypothetical protein